MARLIGRGAEIRELNRAFADPETKTVAVWGRRRVGKTALVREFCRDKTHIILTAVEGSFEGSLRSFDRSLDAFTGTEGNGSKSLGDVLERIMSIFAGGERLVIVFDDYPLLSVADKASD
ncbi:MAG: ATP-binding protein, partial [Candidatus Methanomethylophilaceae archaeon]|nr:ATP-binding protein [Candidatus Methanomethylophilaceae archaeon]